MSKLARSAAPESNPPPSDANTPIIGDATCEVKQKFFGHRPWTKCPLRVVMHETCGHFFAYLRYKVHYFRMVSALGLPVVPNPFLLPPSSLTKCRLEEESKPIPPSQPKKDKDKKEFLFKKPIVPPLRKKLKQQTLTLVPVATHSQDSGVNASGVTNPDGTRTATKQEYARANTKDTNHVQGQRFGHVRIKGLMHCNPASTSAASSSSSSSSTSSGQVSGQSDSTTMGTIPPHQHNGIVPTSPFAIPRPRSSSLPPARRASATQASACERSASCGPRSQNCHSLLLPLDSPGRSSSSSLPSTLSDYQSNSVCSPQSSPSIHLGLSPPASNAGEAGPHPPMLEQYFEDNVSDTTAQESIAVRIDNVLKLVDKREETKKKRRAALVWPAYCNSLKRRKDDHEDGNDEDPPPLKNLNSV